MTDTQLVPSPTEAGPPTVRQPDAPDAALAETVGAHAYRAVAVPTIRVAGTWIASLAVALPLLFEILASTVLAGDVHRYSIGLPPRSTFERWAWLYDYTPTVVRYVYPPAMVMLALVLAVIFAGNLTLDRRKALKKAGLRVTFRASAEQQRLGQELSDLGFAKTLFRARGRRGLLVAFELAALVVTGWSAYTLIAREALFDEAGTLTTTGGLKAGLGPTVCLIAGVVAIAGGVLAWPWTKEQYVLVHLDGTLHTDAGLGPENP